MYESTIVIKTAKVLDYGAIVIHYNVNDGSVMDAHIHVENINGRPCEYLAGRPCNFVSYPALKRYVQKMILEHGILTPEFRDKMIETILVEFE